MLLIGAICLNNDAPYLGVVLVSVGQYGVIAGAVARGMDLSRGQGPPGEAAQRR